jgi:DNA repair photolyase
MTNNMYDWVAKCRPNFIGGQCPHNCKYCHVKDSPWPNVRKKYTGKIRLFEDEFKKPLKSDNGKPIFIGSCFDMWADAVPDDMILRVLYHLRKFDNQYVFQTKNTRRFNEFLSMFHKSDILGTTIESNDYEFLKKMSLAPGALNRAKMLSFRFMDYRKFVTIEPVLQFNLENLVQIIRIAEPTWVNIGADSKGHNLPEPSWPKVQALIAELSKFTKVHQKSNLERLKNA